MKKQSSDKSLEKQKATNLAKVLRYYKLIYEVGNHRQKIMCPFHQDANPSMLINLDNGTWFCFGCNNAGDGAKFVQMMEKKYNGLNDLQARQKYIKILKSKEVSDIVIDVPNGRQAVQLSKQLYDEAYDYYHGLRMPNWLADEEPEILDARSYMENRGFEPETLQIVKAKVTYQYSYGLIFPITDNGKFKGWVSRTMHKEIEAKRKYLYNAGFSRATTLCGNYGSEKYVFVVEGYMDRLRFVQNGITNVVALLGWKMSAQQEEKLKAAGVTDIISVLDNDECGKKGTQYLKTISGFNVTRWCFLKGIKDPGDMNKENFNKMYMRTMSKYRATNNPTKTGDSQDGRISQQYQKRCKKSRNVKR